MALLWPVLVRIPLLALLLKLRGGLALPTLDPLPPRQDVRQQFLFDSSGPFTFFFQDTFCPGLATLIWDNDIFLGTTPSLQNFCGISASGFTQAIIDPQFTSGQYDLPAGFHNLTVLVYASPTPNGRATVSLNIFPRPGAQIVFKSILKEWIPAGQVNVEEYLQRGKQQQLLHWYDGPAAVPEEAIRLM